MGSGATGYDNNDDGRTIAAKRRHAVGRRRPMPPPNDDAPLPCPVWFNLCVDDFGIKYIGREHLQHLYDALQKETYEIVEDLEGDLYCDIALN